MNDKLVPIEHDGQRVITTELLAQVYETDTNNITQNFKRNKSNFREGVHYFLLQGRDLDAFRLQVTDSHLQISPMTRSLYLWTELGSSRSIRRWRSAISTRPTGSTSRASPYRARKSPMTRGRSRKSWASIPKHRAARRPTRRPWERSSPN